MASIRKFSENHPQSKLLVVALVHLDTRDHAIVLDDVHDGLALCILLKQRLPMEDHSADVLAQAGS